MYKSAQSILALALFALLPTASASMDRAACLLVRSEELAAMSACGDTAQLSLCLASVASDATVSVVADCFVNAGCSAEDSAIEAGSALKQCEKGFEGAELRIRGMESMPYITDSPALVARQAAPASVQCSTDTTLTTSTCTNIINGAETSRTCMPTTVVTQVCDSKNVCMTDPKGIPICMVRKDMPTTDGLVVAIFLVVVFVIGCGTMIFLCCQDSRQQKRIKAQHEAAQIAKSNKVVPEPAAAPPPAAGGQDPFDDPNRQH